MVDMGQFCQTVIQDFPVLRQSKLGTDVQLLKVHLHVHVGATLLLQQIV